VLKFGLTAGYLFNPDLHACIAHSRKDYPQARKLYLQAIQKLDLVGEKNVRAKTIQYLGILERDDGHLQLAQVYFENALDSKRKVGQQYEVSVSLALMGQILHLQGDRVAAREYFKESLLIAKTASRPNFPLILVSTIFAKRAPKSAARILAVIHGFYANKSNPPLFPLAKLDYENAISQARLQLGEVAFEVAWAEGGKLSLNEVLDLAIKTLEKI
jgi:tetratricopeptide (TPR) repeat protein